MNLSDIRIPEDVAKRYLAYQKTIFFSKADGGYPVGMEESHKEAHETALKEVFREKLGKELTELSEYPRRTLHYVYGVKAGDEEFAVRINAAGDFYRELQFIVEAWALAKLKDIGIPSLDVIDIDVSREKVPFDYEITSHAEGKTLFDWYRSGTFDPTIFRKLGEALAHIHTIHTEGYGPIDPVGLASGSAKGIHDSWGTYITLNLERHIDICVMLEVISADEAKQIHEALAGLSELKVERPALLHGDVANHNAFTNGKGITALIDWEDCVSGDPLYDVAYYGSSCFGREDWHYAFLEGYKSVCPIDQEFPKRYWLYYLRIAVMKAIVRQRFGSRNDRTPEDIRERIILGLSKLTIKGT